MARGWRVEGARVDGARVDGARVDVARVDVARVGRGRGVCDLQVSQVEHYFTTLLYYSITLILLLTLRTTFRTPKWNLQSN